MSAPLTGPTGLKAEQKFYNTIGISWEAEQDPCELKPDTYKVYRVAGIENDGDVIRKTGSLVGTTTDLLMVDLIPYDTTGFYSYTTVAIHQNVESEPTIGKLVYL